MEGRQLPWITLGDSNVWRNLGQDFPGIRQAFKGLAETMEKVFRRDLDELVGDSIAVYSTGRLACEDFVEIAFLAEHGYGVAALKLLRGIYERTVVGRHIASDPQEARRFFDYNIIDMEKFRNRAARVYTSDWEPLRDSEDEKIYEQMRKQFKYDPCENCGRSTQDSFTKHSLPALARKIGAGTMRLSDGTQKEITMEENYLLCASIPNAHVHASMWSFLQRLRETSCGDVWNEDQSFQAKVCIVVSPQQHANGL